MNLVFLLERELGIALTDAMGRVVDLCNKETQAYRRLVASHPSRGVHVDESVRAYVRCCDHWIRGHLGWYGASKQYA